MMTKSLSYLYILLLCTMLVGCDSDDEQNYPVESIIGEWFVDESDGHQVNFMLMEFTSDGKYSNWEVLSGLTNNYNMLSKGTYRYDGTIQIISKDEYDARQFYQEYQVNSVDQYTLDLVDMTYHEVERLYRVVDTYRMCSGENRSFTINDPDFNPICYKSCDETIAKVDDDGVIHALKCGTTFVRVVSAKGEAVIRVSVTDDDNLIDNFAKYLGMPHNLVTANYGENFNSFKMENGMSGVVYNMYGDYVKEIASFYYIYRHVNLIIVSFRNRADFSEIKSYYDTKYEKLESTDDFSHFYAGQENGMNFVVLLDEKIRQATYQWKPNGLEQWDGMITASVDDVARWFNIDLSEAYMGYYYKILRQDLIYNLSLNYNENTRELLSITLTLNKGISESEIRAWFEERYEKYVSNTGQIVYLTAKVLGRSEYYVAVATSSSGRVTILYMKNEKS